MTDEERNAVRWKWLDGIWRNKLSSELRDSTGRVYRSRGGLHVENAELFYEVMAEHGVELVGDPSPPREVPVTEAGAEEYEDILAAQDILAQMEG